MQLMSKSINLCTIIILLFIGCNKSIEEDNYTKHLNSPVVMNLDINEDHFEKLVENSKLYFKKKISKEIYAKNNRWLNAKININDTIYRVNIKAHGKTPFKHYNGEIMSLKVKFKKKKKFRHLKKFSLVIIEREKFMNKKNEILAKKLNLLYPHFEQVILNINSGKNYLMTLEEPIDINFAKLKYGKNGIILKSDNFKTPLQVLNSVTHVNNKIVTKNEINSLTTSRRNKKIITEINNSINFNPKSFIQYLDTNYAINYLTFIKISGADMHGFLPHNFICITDSVTKKIYPIIHRDIDFKCLYSKKDLYSGTIDWWHDSHFKYSIPLIEILTSNHYIDSISNIKTIEYFNNNSLDDFKRIEKTFDLITNRIPDNNHLNAPLKRTTEKIIWNSNFWLNNGNPSKKITLKYFIENNKVIITITNLTDEELTIEELSINDQIFSNVKIRQNNNWLELNNIEYQKFKQKAIKPRQIRVIHFQLIGKKLPEELTLVIKNLKAMEYYFQNYTEKQPKIVIKH